MIKSGVKSDKNINKFIVDLCALVSLRQACLQDGNQAGSVHRFVAKTIS